MSTRKPSKPTWTAIVFGTSVFAALMMGVGGYQAWSAYLVDEDPDAYQSAAPPAGSGQSMCPGWPARDTDGDSSSIITVGAGKWRDSMSTRSTHSPLGLGSVCN